MTEPRFHTLLLTGAAGALGTELRRALSPLAKTLRLNDREEIADLTDGEEAAVCNLADEEATMAMCEGVDAIVHFGGAPLEKPWDEVLNSSIRGSYHIYEGARRHGVKRVIYASSVHAIGFHSIESHIDATAPHRPDSLYGLSKCFVEDLSRLYWDKYGIESAMLRIFSSYPEPRDRRMLWSWLSYDDMAALVIAALTAPHVGHTIAFGSSDNPMKAFDNRLSGHLGWQPKDSSAPFRAGIEARTETPDPADKAVRNYGGWFCNLGHPDDDAN